MDAVFLFHSNNKYGCFCMLLFSAMKLSEKFRFVYYQKMRLRRIERGALTLASAEVKFQIDTETHDPLDIGMI